MGKLQCAENGRPLKIFNDKDGILVVLKGKAEATAFLKQGDYTVTDDAYILFLKDDCIYQISLKWLMIQYHETFLEYASSSDNGTWNMTGFFKNITVDIPSFNEQIEVVDKYEKLEETENKLNSIKLKVDNLFMKKIF